MTENPHVVAVIGAGPVGLAAAAHLASRGIEPLVFEAGDAVGASIREWGHVRVFSPWEYNVDPIAAELLAEAGWEAPDATAYPTGSDIVERYLEPLGGTAGDRAGAAPRRARGRGYPPRHRQAQGRRPRGRAVRARGRGARRGAALPRLGGDRRVGHVDAPESARRRWRARPGRARGGRPDRVRHPGRARRRSRALRRPARARRRQRPLGVQRHPRPRHAARLRARRRRSCGRSAARRPERKYGGGGDDQLPARGALGATVRSARRRRLGRAGRRLPDPPRLARRRPRGRGRRGRRDHGRRDHRRDRLPPRPVAARRAAARPRRSRRGGAGARSADRPEPALLRLGAAARRRRALRIPTRACSWSV